MSNSDTNGNGEIVEAVVVQSTELAPAGPYRSNDPAEIVDRATEVATKLKDVIQRQQLFTMIQGKPHVRVEGWQMCASMLHFAWYVTETREIDGGFLATVEVRSDWGNGPIIGRADAICSKNEKRGPWKNSDDYARISMAQTRATSKALKGVCGFVISMAGYQTTPAEEMTFVEADPVASVPEIPQEPITDESVVEIVTAAESFDLLDKLQLAASHVKGADVGDCSTKPKARKALGNLSANDGRRLNAWISKKADEVVA